jgi:hypothetical protein
MGTQAAAREQVGDFYLYPIAGRTTLANAQQKQVSFLDVKGAPASKSYWFRNAWLGAGSEAQSFATVLNFSSAKEGGLGDALPAGTVRVYMRDARGQPQFVGEDSIEHTPMGSTLALKTGEAFDVKIQPTVEKREKIDLGEWERVARYRITRWQAGRGGGRGCRARLLAHAYGLSPHQCARRAGDGGGAGGAGPGLAGHARFGRKRAGHPAQRRRACVARDRARARAGGADSADRHAVLTVRGRFFAQALAHALAGVAAIAVQGAAAQQVVTSAQPGRVAVTVYRAPQAGVISRSIPLARGGMR